MSRYFRFQPFPQSDFPRREAVFMRDYSDGVFMLEDTDPVPSGATEITKSNYDSIKSTITQSLHQNVAVRDLELEEIIAILQKPEMEVTPMDQKTVALKALRRLLRKGYLNG